MERQFSDVFSRCDQAAGVGLVELRRPPHNFFDTALIASIADAYEWLDGIDECRALVLAAEGRSFCAGAQFQSDEERATALDADGNDTVTASLYAHAVRLLRTRKPVVAAVHGAAIGGGLGLAVSCDFRIVGPDTRLAANFVKLGISPGFGLTRMLPRLIGEQRAALLMLTGRRLKGEQAVDWGLADLYCPDTEDVRGCALELAAEIAEGAPLAVESTRATLRQGLADAIAIQTDHELSEQTRLRQSEDHAEGVAAVAERRPGVFRRR